MSAAGIVTETGVSPLMRNSKNLRRPSRSATSDPSKGGVAKQAWMLKRGRMFKTWRRRWFVLRTFPPELAYHKDKESPPKDVLLLAPGTVAAVSTMAANCFVISVTHPEPRDLYIQCDTAARCTSWIDDINDIVSEAYMARPVRKPPGAISGVEEGIEYVSDEDEDDPSQEDAIFNMEFARKLSTRLWDENASNLPSLIPIKEGEKGVSPLGGSGSAATSSPSLGPTGRKGSGFVEEGAVGSLRPKLPSHLQSPQAQFLSSSPLIAPAPTPPSPPVDSPK